MTKETIRELDRQPRRHLMIETMLQLRSVLKATRDENTGIALYEIVKIMGEVFDKHELKAIIEDLESCLISKRQ